MRGWLSDRTRMTVLAAGLVMAAIVVGVVWGVAEAGSADAAASTTTVPGDGPTSTAALASTTTEPTSTTLSDSSSTTTRSQATTPAGSGPGNGSNATTPANRAPIVEDPGISSDGMLLTVAPLISDPDSDVVAVRVSVDPGESKGFDAPPGVPGALGFTYDPSLVGNSLDVVVSVEVTDDAGNQVVETYEHRLEAVTTVDVHAVLQLRSCSQPAIRVVGDLELSGIVDDSHPVNEELRPDRRTVELVKRSAEALGDPPAQQISFSATRSGEDDTFEDLVGHTDDGAPVLFSGDCRVALLYDIEFSTR